MSHQHAGPVMAANAARLHKRQRVVAEDPDTVAGPRTPRTAAAATTTTARAPRVTTTTAAAAAPRVTTTTRAAAAAAEETTTSRGPRTPNAGERLWLHVQVTMPWLMFCTPFAQPPRQRPIPSSPTRLPLPVRVPISRARARRHQSLYHDSRADASCTSRCILCCITSRKRKSFCAHLTPRSLNAERAHAFQKRASPGKTR